ncbi:MAG: M23 family metallopeptidase [Vicinamibacteria bacterium]
MNRAKAAFALLVLLLLPNRLPERMAAPAPSPPRLEPLKILHGEVAPRSTLAAMLDGSLSPGAVHALVEAARPVYDLARVGAGRPFGLALGPDGLVAAFSYGIDELRTLRVRRMGDELRADILSREYETRVAAVSGVIESSLFGAVTDAGEADQLALDLAEIFAWDIDFNTELQQGDSFKALVEKQTLDGRFVRYGRILAAEFVRGEHAFQAIRFASSRGDGYYAPDGTPLRKAFLRSPLRFTRISSRFSTARRHPVLDVVRAHRGVDYAAPSGTPVSASGSGVVAAAGWQGQLGRAVRVRHPNGYETVYGHLSRVLVRPGQRVAQGDTIGAVGSSGLASGAHLHYGMRRDGRPVNPLTIQSPRAEPVAPAEREAFLALAAERGAELDRLPVARLAVAAAPAHPAAAEARRQ